MGVGLSETRRGLEDLRRALARVAGEAAGFLRDRFGQPELLEVRVRHGEDYGMEIDVEAEDYIKELLRAEGLGGAVLGEEEGFRRLGDGDLLFIIDPLDGSKNYACQIPWNAVSIAAAPYREEGPPRLTDILAGAIAPVQRHPVYSFARGLGLYEGGRRLTALRKPPAAMILTYTETPEQARLLQAYLRLSGRRSIRSLGSASLEILWAGLGRVEAFMDVRGRLRPVDIAAAIWAAREAGAYVAVTDTNQPVTGLGRVGFIAVTAYRDAWERLRRALLESGLGDPADHLLAGTPASRA